MQKKEIEEVVRIAAAEILVRREEIIKDEYDARYQDVKLLMKNYRRLKTYYDKVSPETLEVDSIFTMRRKTGLMMSHVDCMLSAYQAMCQEALTPDEARRWDALYARYISDERKSVDDIAAQLGIDKRTFYRDISLAMEDLAVLLFGIEALGARKNPRR